MGQHNKRCLLLGILILMVITVKGQRNSDSVRYVSEKDSTIGIRLTKSEFDGKVSKYLKLMSNWTPFQANDYIEMVRLYNTIGDTKLIKVDYYRMYYQIFLVMYLKKAASELEAKLSKGMAMYSEKYNLWIGDEPLGNNSSRYNLSTK